MLFDPEEVTLGISPIGWTNDDMPDLGGEIPFPQCVDEMALAGFTKTELGNKYPRDPAALLSALKPRGLSICNSWFSTYLISKPFEETETPFREKCGQLRALGAKIIGVSEQSGSIQGKSVPIFGSKPVMSGGEWDLLTSGLNRLGEISAGEYGISLCYHHHMGTVVQSEGEVERLMSGTDPRYVSLLYDSGHFAYAGADPDKMARLYARRTRHIHLKSVRNSAIARVKSESLSFLEGVRLGTFTVPGDGDLRFEGIFSAFADAGYEGVLLVEAEQDPATADPLVYAQTARAYIKKKTGL